MCRRWKVKQAHLLFHFHTNNLKTIHQLGQHCRSKTTPCGHTGRIRGLEVNTHIILVIKIAYLRDHFVMFHDSAQSPSMRRIISLNPGQGQVRLVLHQHQILIIGFGFLRRLLQGIYDYQLVIHLPWGYPTPLFIIVSR